MARSFVNKSLKFYLFSCFNLGSIWSSQGRNPLLVIKETDIYSKNKSLDDKQRWNVTMIYSSTGCKSTVLRYFT